MKYPVAERALKKWQGANLDKSVEPDSFIHYSFSYQGSTCSNGGDEFKAVLHARISPEGTVDRAWIEIPPEEHAAAMHMCTCPGSESLDASGFFDSLARDASFCGRSLEEIILEEVPLNHAGCFCHPPMVNQKWKIALSTMHFDLFS